ncbi:MAG: hypothetical protein WBM28_17910 [Burkholderiales bacterium]
MKSRRVEILRGAVEILGQLLPRNVLRDARGLALKIQRDEVFRDYLVTRISIVLPVVFVFVFVSTVCAVGVMFFSVHLLSPPVPLWLRGFALLVGAVVWLGGVAAQLFVFMIWLGKIAVRKNRLESGKPAAVPAGMLAYLKYSGALPFWILVAIFVVVPLGYVAVYTPQVALLCAGLGVLAPVLFNKFDP